jgi:hypothetical protein
MEYEKKYQELKNRILNITNDDFEAVAVELFQFQYEFNNTYKEYCNALKIDRNYVTSSSQIPFLPIQFFKSRTIKTGTFEEVAVFESSGTTGSISSKHFVKDLSIYEKSFLQSFTEFYGNISEYCIIGLLPSYLERQHSSLVYMVDKLISLSGHTNSGFYLYDFEALKNILELNEANQQKTLLIGVSYALLDFSEKFPMQLNHTIVMETGGMKGRREELSKQELHKQLKHNFGVNEIHSEYGMTELLSQAYSKGNGIFNCPPWMKIIVRELDNPLETMTDFNSSLSLFGGINVIDLANINSCCFIATEDAGIVYADGSFEITGRIEDSDIRGCGLMIV